MPWREGLSDEQIVVAGHVGNHARLLAGPGTGKTRALTHRVMCLVLEHGVSAHSILALTFTRLAAYELRRKVAHVLAPFPVGTPRVSTLHGFALRQLLRNATRIDALPHPLRIADDWEERHIVWEDIKERVREVPGREHGLTIRQVEKLFDRLSADWETLQADVPGTEELFPDPAFIQCWREHRAVFGYTLRDEMVYQLKRALNQYYDFDLEGRFRYVLVDEYQDLNACDLAVVRQLADRGAEIFAAGDDDQSIYGFRHAHPQGIRQFHEDYRPWRPLTLTTCYRCDRSILRAADFVASLDTSRQPKSTTSVTGAGLGEVRLAWFRNENEEADGIARRCHRLITACGIPPQEILVLLRSDTHRALSSVIREALCDCGIPAATHATGRPTDTNEGRMALALMRLLVDAQDQLAWRTALQLTPGIGKRSLRAAGDWATSNRIGFADALNVIVQNPALADRVGGRLASATTGIRALLDEWSMGQTSLDDTIRRVSGYAVADPQERAKLVAWLLVVVEETSAQSLDQLVNALGASIDRGEQELEPDVVNILTMHKAKGLDADTVFIAGAEDEFLPGRNEGDREGDERRLLFVSMTRAKHRLFITYCRRRTGQQARLGRPTGRSTRCLTRFLRDAPIQAEDGSRWTSTLSESVS